ncbi:MAG: hypothetical protein HZB35_04515 [Nitrospirae bacterium]|nr:hypothetical protein [Nitrospirota bacterium]
MSRIHHLCVRGILIALIVLELTSGCASPPTIERAGVEYDRAVTNVIIEQLLLNIARQRHHHPIHFTVVSNVAATFDFRMNAGIGHRLLEEPGLHLVPILGGTIAENPTISIVPVEGEEFTKRLLTPMDETKFYFLARQGVDLSVLLRLLARDFWTEGIEGEQVFVNSPREKSQYEEFRRRVLHLEALRVASKLYAEPLVFEKTWEMPLNSPEAFQALEKGYQVTHNVKGGTYLLRKQVTGRVVITNYDPSLLSNEIRYHLNQEANKYSTNQVLVDIRPGYPGGDYPFHGGFRLRSFNAILAFIARGIDEEVEFAVEPDPRTGPTLQNPAKSLEILETERRPAGQAFGVKYKDWFYSLKDAAVEDKAAARWNLDSFRVLYQLFQMTVTDVSKTLVPGITIAK